MNESQSHNITVLATVFASFFFASSVMACNCSGQSDCFAYTNAKSVFTGELVRAESSAELVHTYFKVKKQYKGASSGIVRLTFRAGECLRVEFVPGEDYIVFNEGEQVQSLCNRTDKIANSRNVASYLDSLPTEKPTFLIGATVFGPSDDQIRRSRISIRNSTDVYELSFDKYGMFSFSSSKESEFHVSISFPIRATVEVFDPLSLLTKNSKVIFQDQRTILEYSTIFQPNGCDMRQIELVARRK